jgi:uncharacterized protein YggL (DUF469 family)
MNMNTDSIKLLKIAVQEGVNAKVMEASAKDLLSSVIETTKEKLGGSECTLDIRALVSQEYTRQYDREKWEKNKAKIEDIYEALEEIQ